MLRQLPTAFKPVTNSYDAVRLRPDIRPSPPWHRLWGQPVRPWAMGLRRMPPHKWRCVRPGHRLAVAFRAKQKGKLAHGTGVLWPALRARKQAASILLRAMEFSPQAPLLASLSAKPAAHFAAPVGMVQNPRPARSPYRHCAAYRAGQGSAGVGDVFEVTPQLRVP